MIGAPNQTITDNGTGITVKLLRCFVDKLILPILLKFLIIHYTNTIKLYKTERGELHLHIFESHTSLL